MDFKKVVILFLCLLAYSYVGFSQEEPSETSKSVARLERRADRLFDDFSYITARDIYKRVVKLDSANDRAKLRVAECYLKLNDAENAEEWYKKLSDDYIQQSSYDLINFGESLLKNKKYAPAKRIYEAVAVISPNDIRVSNLLKGIQDIDKFFLDSLKFEVRLVDFNSEQSDFSPAFFNDGIAFVSGRNSGLPVKYVYNWDHTNFLDIYYAERYISGRFKEAERLDSKINTRYHEGPLSFYDDDKKLIFTRNNFVSGVSNLSSEGVNRLQLFYTERPDKTGKWKKPVIIDVVSKEYSAGHPTVTRDGKKMYYSSNIPGGFGEADLYYSEYNDGKWSNPINLGAEINTNGNELFPFISDEGTLYFASDGHQGLGGLDIFKAEFLKDGKVAVKNMGYPLNTNLDDFGLIVSGDKGYFSSQRLGNDNIYEIFFNFVPVQVVLIDSLTKKEITGKVSVVNNTTGGNVNLVEVNGKMIFDSPRGHQMLITGEADGYTKNTIEFTNDNIEYTTEPHRVEVLLSPIKKIEIPKVEQGIYLTGTIYDEATKLPIPGSLEIIPGFKGSAIKVDSSGYYSVKLPGTGNYLFEAKSHGYFSKTDSLDIPATTVNKTYVKDFYLKQALIGAKIRLNRVFFDFDKATLRPISKIELDKIVAFMKENPELLVEIGGHTDDKGSNAYNAALSGRRAASVRIYLIENGIPQNRMTYKGYGEEEPEVPNDTDYNRQLNRRVEFKITGIDYNYEF
jgi:outer membrane protein OmpA-like peptidoglycan-associated protein/tetratricopeptide (TPR) repeat protein